MARVFGDLQMTTLQETGFAHIPMGASLQDVWDGVRMLGIDPRDMQIHERRDSRLVYVCFHGPQREDGVIRGRYCSMARADR